MIGSSGVQREPLSTKDQNIASSPNTIEQSNDQKELKKLITQWQGMTFENQQSHHWLKI